MENIQQDLLKKVQGMDLQQFVMDFILPYSVKLLIAIVIFYVGRKIIRLISALIRKGMDKSGSDPMLIGFIMSIFDFVAFILVVIASLSQLGVDTSSFVALIGAAGLAVGLSVKDSLQNFAAGVMILIFKPFQKGHFIEGAGVAGTVEDIGLIVLKLKTPDNKMVIVPNAGIFNSNITNYSITGQRRVDLTIGIAYSADLKKAKEVIMNEMKKETRLLTHIEPVVGVSNLGQSSVDLFARVWVKTGDFFAVQSSLLENIKLALDENGIEIPFNTLDVNLKTQG